MFYFNQVAAEQRPLRRATKRTEIALKIDGYKLAVQRGKAAAAAAGPDLQAFYDATLAKEAAAGQTRVDTMLAALKARVAAI